MKEYPRIKSTTDLRMAYSFLSLSIETALPIDFVVEVKRAIREYNHRETDHDRRIVSGDYDSCVLLISLPENIGTEAEAKSYFENVEYCEPVFSAYDCTGRWFTSWYRLFKRRGRWCAYHCMCLDV